jgi:hypothetical protein
MGLFSGLGSMISSACSMIGNALGSLGGTLATSASSFLKVVAPWLGTVVQIIQIVAVLLDVLGEKEDVEELGAKAMQADSKKPEEFESNKEYIEYLSNEVELDKEKFEQAGDVEKTARTAVGASIVVKGIEEKKGFEIPNEVWVQMAKINLVDKAKEIDTILDTFKDDKFDSFIGYTKGNLDEKKEFEVKSNFVEMYKELEPNATEEEIENKIMQMEVGDK